jgi:hypothetical protein
MPEGSKDKNNRDRWSSLTELQYDRLAKWAAGTFSTGEPKAPYSSFEEIPPEERPDALTRAAIEWSVGAPLYPGIEVYWTAEFDHMYKPKDKYRFADTVRPGDLGKGLSLPWQADFYMCNTHWYDVFFQALRTASNLWCIDRWPSVLISDLCLHLLLTLNYRSDQITSLLRSTFSKRARISRRSR